VVNVSDRFGDYGLTGVILFRIQTRYLEVDTFLLSCRVLGRGVEHRVANELGRTARRNQLPAVAMRYRRTARNEPARAFVEGAFAEFRTLTAAVVDPSAEAAFLVPTEYAESVKLMGSERKEVVEDDVERKAPEWVEPAMSAPRWHNLTYR
jgi:hypothetical protein